MSFVMAVPEVLGSAATDLVGLGSTVTAANAAAANHTTAVLAAADDEVSVAIAALFSSHGQAYQQASSQAAAWHAEFVQALNGARGVVCGRRSRECVAVADRGARAARSD